MRSLFCFILMFLLIGVTNGQQKLPKSYIRFEYRGLVDKPIPEIFFSTESIVLERNMWGVSYRVNECNFLKIRNSIEDSQVLTIIDTADIGYYQFLIVTPRVTRLYKANNSSEVRLVFNEIEKRITTKEKQSITNFFRDITSRIK